jgi:hypothetical protein
MPTQWRLSHIHHQLINFILSMSSLTSQMCEKTRMPIPFSIECIWPAVELTWLPLLLARMVELGAWAMRAVVIKHDTVEASSVMCADEQMCELFDCKLVIKDWLQASPNPIYLYMSSHLFERPQHQMDATLGELDMCLITSIVNMCLFTSVPWWSRCYSL